MAKESIVPSTMAMSMAINARRAEETIAFRALSTCTIPVHQLVVNPRGGHANDLAELKERTTTKSNGTYKTVITE